MREEEEEKKGMDEKRVMYLFPEQVAPLMPTTSLLFPI
jgi:hypothetical protein